MRLIFLLIITSILTAMTHKNTKNVLGNKLESCCYDPMTGFFRDGFCRTNHLDYGTHVVCAVLTDEFLEFSKAQGNDLITPRLEFQFPGLKAGDKWCLCALRWLEAYENGVAPPIKAEATNEKVFNLIDKAILEKHYIQ